jgi:hypothetical protein
MPVTNPAEQSKRITWSFQVMVQGMVVRYGRLGDLFYKQVLPGGVEIPGRYPPRPIEVKLFDIAQRQYNDSLNIKAP